MYARPARYAPRPRRGSPLSGTVLPCSAAWMEGPNARGCMENWCQDTDMQTGEPVGDPYKESESCQVYTDARSETVNVPGAVPGEATTVTYQQRTEYVVPYGSTAPAPDSPEWNAWVEAARAGTVYQNVVGAGAGFGEREATTYAPAGTFERGELPAPEEYAPEWWADIAFGNGGGAELAAPERAGVSPLVLAAGAGALLLLVLPRRRRAA